MKTKKLNNNITWAVKFATGNNATINSLTDGLTANSVGIVVVNAQLTSKAEPFETSVETLSFTISAKA